MNIINTEIMFDVDNNIEINNNNNFNNINNNKEKEDLIMKILKEIKENMMNVIIFNGIICMERCKWLIITPCCLFITLLSWDIVGDKEGWKGSYWISLIGIGIMIIIWIIDYLKKTILQKITNK